MCFLTLYSYAILNEETQEIFQLFSYDFIVSVCAFFRKEAQRICNDDYMYLQTNLVILCIVLFFCI